MSKPADEKDLVQAVVLADSFNSRFAPVARSLPRALFPLAGVPLIDYALNCLADAGVHECIVYCRSHYKSLASHLASSPQSKRFATPPVVRKCPPTVSSLGDAIRDLDQSRLIKNDFILAPADLVTNANLAELLAEHKRRRVKDANCLLTLVMRSTTGGFNASALMQAQERSFIAVSNADTGCLRMLSPAGMDKLGRIRLERAALLSCGRSRLWTGLIDLGLAVCSVHVPPRFTDEFDYRSLDDLVRGVLEHEEILGHTVSLHVLGGQEYACRVSNMNLYALVTRHLLDNWVYPMTPASMSGSRAATEHQVRQRNVYVSRLASVHRSARLEKSVLIGPGAQVGSGCHLVNCVIGSNCRVGDRTRLSDCYLWPGAVVSSDCNISRSLLCHNSTVLDDSQLTDRCVLTHGVRVGPSVVLTNCRLIVRSGRSEDSASTDEEVKQQLGKDSNAAVYKSAYSDRRDEAGDSDADSGPENDEDSVELEIWQTTLMADNVEYLSSESDSSSEAGNEVPPAEVGEDHFKRELLDVLQRAEQDKHPVDTMVVEINSIKHAFCVHIDRLKAILAYTILLYPLLKCEKDDESEDCQVEITPAEHFSQVKDCLENWKPLLKHYFNGFSSQDESLIFLRSFEDACCDRPQPLMKCALVLLRYFYDTDLCEEAAILSWNSEEGSHPNAGELRQCVARMIQWLQEASEESD
ncbi:hypothetical protein BOX15_Mlig029426g2 [Macrostomum lignano]|uniref:Translation initiation factor eIF2B subunit epsilon n=1 Tax=Macrostomum lignano TaxID=282301 RepID=A0A267DHX3_9PLAT|nr:hypothetical protein BOX15_Mlig029426g2 [Macrostomum lignano]